MGKKRQKVRWLSIEDNVDGRNPSRVTAESEEGDRMSLSPPVVVEISASASSHVPPNRLMDKGGPLPYARRPVAPRFERKAAAEVLYESSSRSYRGRELSGDSSEELPMGFTKIRSKNLDVLFKRDYYSTKGGLNSEANTHSETSSLTQKEDEKEEEEVEELEVEEEVLEEEFEVVEEVEEQGEGETTSKSNKESVSKSTTSKLNGSSSPFYPSSPGYVMPVHPYVTGRPNLFLYSPSSNTMIPCEEVVVPSMFPGSPSSPQNVYLAAFPMEGSHHPYMMAPSYPSPPYYSPQPVYSDAEPSSAESTLPHSPPELSAYNPAYWGDIHHQSQRGNYVHGYHYQPDPSYTPLEGISPQRTPEKMPVVPEVEDKKEDEEAIADSNALEGRRVPGLPPQPKKSQKKKRKKKNKNPSELVHRNSTSSEEGRSTTTTSALHLLKDESSTSPAASSESISFDESSKKSPESSSPLYLPPSEQGDIVEPVMDDEDVKTIPERAKSPVKEEEEILSVSPPVEHVAELEKDEPIEEQPPCIEEKEEVEASDAELSSSEVMASSAKESSPQAEVEEKSSNVMLVTQVEEVVETPASDEVIDKVPESNPRMLYSSVVSQSMPKSPSHNSNNNIKPSSKAAAVATTTSEAPSLTTPTPKAKEAPLPVSTSLENLRPAEEADSGEWLESSSRKKIKRQRQSKKSSKSSKYSSSPSSSVTRSVSLESSSQKKEEESNTSLPAEKVEEFSRSLESLPAAPTTKSENHEEKVEEEDSQNSPPTKSNELAEERILSNSAASPSKKPLSKKKKNKQRGDSSATNSKVSNSTNSDTSKKQVLICDGAIDVSSSFSSLKRVSDIGCLRLHSQTLSKGSIGLDTLFISDVGLGIRNGPIMSGRPLRVGKYNPPDRAGEILSMKASLVSSTKENAQYMPLD